jgi:hypothetical protein
VVAATNKMEWQRLSVLLKLFVHGLTGGVSSIITVKRNARQSTTSRLSFAETFCTLGII